MKNTPNLMRSGALLCSLLLTGNAMAAVTPEEAAQLHSQLTPIGAERGASPDGRIPAWDGSLGKANLPLTANGTPADPYAGEKPLFRIDASNYSQYQEHLSPGQIALLKRFPDSFHLPVYPTHRSVAVPDSVRDAAARNASSARLINDGNGVEGFAGVIAFPIPKSGLEVLWNHLTRNRNGSFSLISDSAAPQKDGSYAIMTTQQYFTRRDRVNGLAPNEANNILYYYSHKLTAPSRMVGEVVLVHETLDQVAEPRLSWVYSAGQRRVRRAPSVAYDTAGPTTAGLRTADSRDMFNGAPDRYDWQLVGKKTLYVPYNSYRLASPDQRYDKLILPGHVNPEATRYELHRVWEVVATLKPGMRHIYSKRHYFIDEDTWAILEADHYDNRGELWRVGEAHSFYHSVGQSAVNAMEITYDLNNGRYLASGLTSEQRQPFDFSYQASVSDYSPGALRSKGLR
ncbi:DUF1329 domain-containing protein [Pseudomonas sp. L-22-4S-12]|uniref:DUF1329 domain-containing protein n=1 Tax=Pseudomonas sp. L-22-4S-12 TaxID=2610893 RepID=UPI001326B160|nr:DUF1329 domain-containing protein [Pseudomonas sp. L-22-4S-12]MWV14605.1 DUF1329 domain-containing protein [Pseudomonas sp. L-22-4S-12]